MVVQLLKRINSSKLVCENKAGFSLVELLAVIVTSSIVMSSLLFLTNNLTQANRKEIARSSTQEEMQRALDYIARDLREAVYVYNGAELNGSRTYKSSDDTDVPYDPLLNFLSKDGLPNELQNDDNQIILAFWKVESIGKDEIPNCANITDMDEQALCKNLEIERRAYSLIVYVQSKNKPEDVWQGKSRIKRYKLEKYTKATLEDTSTSLKLNKGYVDPQGESDFSIWPFSKQNITIDQQGSGGLDRGLPDMPDDVLVDYVALPSDGDDDPCDGLNDPSIPEDLEYTRTPFNDSGSSSDDKASFYACVSTTPDNSKNGKNQHVRLYLRGNSKGRSSTLDADAFLPVLETGVMIRGLINQP